MNTSSYGNSVEVLEDRIQWAIAVIGALVQRGRNEGWLEGRALDALPDVAALEARIEARSAATEPHLSTHAMEWLGGRLGLAATELSLLWLLACVEHAPAVARLAGALGDADCPGLSLQLVQQLVPVTCTEVAALHERGLLELDEDPRRSYDRRSVRACDRVVAIARGEIGLDRELAAFGELARPDELAARGAEVPEVLVRACGDRVLAVAVGAAGSGRATLLAHAAARTERGILRLRCEELAREPERLGRRLRAIVRECQLFGVLPLLVDVHALPAHLLDREVLRRFDDAVLATSTVETTTGASRPIVVHRVEPMPLAARTALWRRSLPGCDAELVGTIAARYTATPATIVAAARSALVGSGGRGDRVTVDDVQRGLRAHLDERLAGLATRVTCTQTWKDLVLPSDQLDQIVELVARVRHRGTVLEDWGFADKIGRGTGVAALMSGPPGTGKTMVAGLIARELGLDLYQVDLSKVVSKYIGETEKQLGAIFDAAETGHAIVLFDEADALFAKRTEVKSSNDRYANLEVNYLLQRIEQFRGISLLTTNHASAIDDAFRRRVALHIRFGVPDEEQRAELWRAMIPSRARVADDLDFDALARAFAMTGGYIKNAVVRAAYLAAHADSAITTALLQRAARLEYEAMGKITWEAA